VKLAVFASATDNYVPKALTALLSFRRWHPDFGYYLLGTSAHMRLETLRLLDKYELELIDLDESRQYLRKKVYDSKFPVETVYLLKGPELMKERGFDFGISIDGDTFCYRPLQLETVLPSVSGLAGRPVRSLSRTLRSKQAEKNSEFDFSLAAVKSTLGIAENDLAKGTEINGGFVIWNNHFMAEIQLFKKCLETARKCFGCFEGNQDLMAFVVALKKIPITELDYPYHLLLSKPKKKKGPAANPLRADASREYFGDVRVIHFIDPKPWASASVDSLSLTQIHFINAWRSFAKHTLGADFKTFFSELSPLPGDPVRGLENSLTARHDGFVRRWVAGWKRLVK
jgi:hypothetical protein